MALIDDIKKVLRISVSQTAFDGEVQDLIDAAKLDLLISGIASTKASDDTDDLIKRAISLYVKAHFGYDNPDADRFLNSYESLKTHLALSGDYNVYTVTFTVKCGLAKIDDATITIDETELTTNSQGVAIYATPIKLIDVDYTVSAAGYSTATGTVYVDGNETVEVVLSAI